LTIILAGSDERAAGGNPEDAPSANIATAEARRIAPWKAIAVRVKLQK